MDWQIAIEDIQQWRSYNVGIKYDEMHLYKCVVEVGKMELTVLR